MNEIVKTSSSVKRYIRSKFFLNHLKKFPKHEKTLDLGAGWGISLLVNSNFYCCDGNNECVEYLKSQTPLVKKYEANAILPYNDNFFNNVFTHDFLEHLTLEEIDNVYVQVARVIKKGGYFLNVVPNKPGYDYGFKIGASHKTFVTEKIISNYSAKHGFKTISSWTSPFPPFLQNLYKHNKVCVLSRFSV